MSSFLLVVGRGNSVTTGVFAASLGHVVQDFTSKLNVVVSKLTDLGVVDTEDFSFFRSAEGKTRNEVHDEKDDACSSERINTTGDGISKLVTKLDPVLVEPSTWNLGETIKMGYVVSSEEGGEDVSDKSTNGVFGEDIKSVIDAKDKLELGSIIGTGSSHNTIDDGGPGRNETRSGSDSDETSNDTGAEADGGPFALKTIIEDTPCDTSNAGSQVGDDCGHDSAHVCCESGTK